MKLINGVPIDNAPLLKTGQTTQYSSELDDGYYQKGKTRAYQILDTGQWSGTNNVDLIHAISNAGDITFANNNPAADTIASVTLNFTNIIVAGDVLVISGATDAGNNRVVTVDIVAANLLTLTESNVLTNAAPDANAITFAKREAKSNNCVKDLRTGLIWLQNPSNTPAKMGVLSNGKMPWTGQLYDIFQYCAAVNVAAVGGYTDWRVANIEELFSILDHQNGYFLPDATAFPNYPAAPALLTSTTLKNATTYVIGHLDTNFGVLDYSLKSAGGSCYVMLVRG